MAQLCEEDVNVTQSHAADVILRLAASHGRFPALLKDRCPALPWRPFCEDPGRRSYAYFLKHHESAAAGSATKSIDDDALLAGRLAGKNNDDDGPELSFSTLELRTWFEQLHPYQNPSVHASLNAGGWEDSYYRGELLGRKTAWAVFDPSCKVAKMNGFAWFASFWFSVESPLSKSSLPFYLCFAKHSATMATQILGRSAYSAHIWKTYFALSPAGWKKSVGLNAVRSIR